MGAGRGSQSHSCHQIGWVGFNFGSSVLELPLLRRLQAFSNPLYFDKGVHCELNPVLPWGFGAGEGNSEDRLVDFCHCAQCNLCTAVHCTVQSALHCSALQCAGKGVERQESGNRWEQVITLL